MINICLTIVFLPLLCALGVGLFGWAMNRQLVHIIAIGGIAISTLLSIYVLFRFGMGQQAILNENLYTWLTINQTYLYIGLLVDQLTVVMLAIVTFISLMVHIYTVGYMADDPGYKRFFSYISLFTFAMLILVVSNNFVQLFFGWEAVGLVSYLLIGFWFKKDSANFASLKAFLVNRIGDFCFLLGIALIAIYFGGSLNYADVFAEAPKLRDISISFLPFFENSLITGVCLLLFVGAMAKSAQFPLHIWLPDSMEGPTPISALIHAATMVTAGIFMVSRMSPLFELSDTALNFMLIIGSITAFFMGLLGVIQNDIKRVIAYSTLSQLGYMTVALGASLYSVSIFHIATHAFFKALLFLGAGSIIITMHHEQDMRRMGNLRRYMPVTWFTFLIGALSLIGTPFFSGFYSKDSIIEALQYSNLPAATFAQFCTIAGVFITTLYTSRMYFMVFHGKENWRKADYSSNANYIGLKPNDHPNESGWSIKLPLIILAVPSIIMGYLCIPFIVGYDFFGQSITVNSEQHFALLMFAKTFHHAFAMGLHGLIALSSFLIAGGIAITWMIYVKRPYLADKLRQSFNIVYTVLQNKYYFDTVYFFVFVKGAQLLGQYFWRFGDIWFIDGLLVNGSAALVNRFAILLKRLQTGYLYSYALVMILGLLILLLFAI
jgi:NADH-quinone oxidoreductase subunit L